MYTDNVTILVRNHIFAKVLYINRFMCHKFPFELTLDECANLALRKVWNRTLECFFAIGEYFYRVALVNRFATLLHACSSVYAVYNNIWHIFNENPIIMHTYS